MGPNPNLPLLNVGLNVGQSGLRRARPQDGWQIRALLRLATHDERRWLPVRRTSAWIQVLGGLLLAFSLYGLSGLLGLRVVLYGLLALGAVGAAIEFYPLVKGDWSRFWVMEQQGRLLACAQLTHHVTYSVLSDVVVARPWQRQGVGSFLVQELSRRAPHPLYLLAAARHLEFYRRLGFAVVSPRQVAPAIRMELGLSYRPHYLLLVLNQRNSRPDLKAGPQRCPNP